MTRAMQDLFLTFAGSRFSFGGRTYQMPSQFLTDLGYNPYGSAGFSDPDDDFEFGLLGGDPDGEFGQPTSPHSSTPSRPASSSGHPQPGAFDDLSQDYDPFPEDVPVYEW